MTKLAFFIGVYKDFELAKSRIIKLREFYTGAAIVSISDGTNDLDYAQFCSIWSVTYRADDRLKLMQHGGSWTHRFLEHLSDEYADLLIKIDPDTGVNSPLDLTRFNDGDVFGNVRVTGGRTHIQGGFIAFKPDAAKKIIESHLLGSDKFCNYKYAYPRYQPPYLKLGEAASSEWLSCEDVILWDVIQELRLKVGECDQVCCHYDKCPEDAHTKYAFTHPAPINHGSFLQSTNAALLRLRSKGIFLD